ncbi:DUF3238 domain-containing protein [Bacillus sp. DJP31]|uniref:DUF3238 domain-containing protein n=1 Tax=Bacillus sp. DJP31 TaxID=3409789 RepID=UPI003BB52A1B
MINLFRKYVFKKLLVLLTVVISLVSLNFYPFTSSNSHAAQYEELKIEIVDKGKSFVNLDWNNVGASYYVLRNGQEVVYEGRKTNYKEKNLDAATFVEYSLYAYDKQDKVIDTYEMTSYTSFEDKNVINYAIGTSDSEVSLDWSDVPDALKYEVYLNDQLLATTSSSQFIHNLENQGSALYRVIVYLPNTDELPEKTNLSGRENIPDSEEIVEGGEELGLKYQYDFKSLYFEVNPLEDKSGFDKVEVDKESTSNYSLSTISAAAATTTSVSVRIRTFIAESCYEEWIPGSGDGDGRGPSATSGTHRTKIDVTSYFGARKDVTFSLNAGETIAYKSNGCKSDDVLDRGTPPMNESGTYTHHGTYTSVSVKHSVGTPVFANLLPNIDYEFDLTVYQGGFTSVSGSHDGFPDYEIYRSSSIGWVRLYHWDASAKGQSIYSLNPPMEIDF